MCHRAVNTAAGVNSLSCNLSPDRSKCIPLMDWRCEVEESGRSGRKSINSWCCIIRLRLTLPAGMNVHTVHKTPGPVLNSSMTPADWQDAAQHEQPWFTPVLRERDFSRRPRAWTAEADVIPVTLSGSFGLSCCGFVFRRDTAWMCHRTSCHTGARSSPASLLCCSTTALRKNSTTPTISTAL